MKKAPCYKGGGKIKGEPDKPVKSTIDRTKYASVLGKPIIGTGTNFVGETPDSFNPEVLKSNGYNYVSGTIGGKDIIYEKNGNYHLYNEQPNAAQNKYGLVNIGNPNNPVTAAPKLNTSTTAPVVKPTIDPNRKPMDFSNPNVTRDPNTGFYYNPVTGKMIQDEVKNYKGGGKVKKAPKRGYGSGGGVDPTLPTYDTNPTKQFPVTNDYNAARAGAQNDQAEINAANKAKRSATARNIANTAGSALGAYGTGYYAANPGETDGDKARSAGMGIVAQTGPIGGAISGIAGIGDQIAKPIKTNAELTDENGNLVNRNLAKNTAIIGGIFSPSKALATRSSYKGGWTDITGDAYADHLEEEAKKEVEAKRAEEKRLNDIKNTNRVNMAIASRDAGDLNQTAFKDGGKIKGAGTGKSDSISARMKVGSFIVPAENSEIAEELREKVLRKAPSKKANLKQSGGEEIKVSNGEHVFTPEEVAELETYGYDVDALAPNSDDNKMGKKDGGLTADKARIMLKEGVANGKALTPDQKRYFGYIIGSESKGYTRGGKVKDGDVPSNKRAGEMMADKKRQDLKNREELLVKKDILARNLELNPNDYFSIAALKDVDGKLKAYNTLYGDIISEPISNNKFNSNASALANKYNRKAPSVSRKEKAAAKEIIEVDTLAPKVIDQIPTVEPTGNLYGERTPEEILRGGQRNVSPYIVTQDVVDNSAIDSNAGAISATTPSGKKKFDYSNVLGNAINYGIPIAQTAIGLNQLKKAGDRPVDSLDADYLNSLGRLKSNVAESERQAKYGYTGAEKAYLENQNNNLTNTGRFAARNLSGGSSANMLNNERAVINDAFGRKLQMSVNDKNLQLQKQNMAFDRQQAYNNAIQDKQDRLRQYFGDDLNAWHQKTGSAAALTNAGLTNALDSYRAEQRLKNYNSQQTNTP